MRDRRYRQENIERVRAKDREYGKVKRQTDENYVAKRREYNRKYIQLYPEKSAQYFNNRRARIQQAGGEFTSREWKKLCKRYDYTCLCCGKREPEIKLTVDHVIPLSAGGTNSIDNIQPLCISCNASKGTRTIDYRIN
jgi:5-methylcytosine-specific restriction endonuclease McrA